MNKTINVNIGGRVFNIEELAYEKLNTYLKTIRGYFEQRESTDEIISDIELRIAELFMERISNQKQVITSTDVDEVIDIMGKPEDYMDGEEDDEEYTYTKSRKKSRQVFRDPDNKVIFGVCSGISAYFGIDPIILRAIFAISFIFYGSGLLIYIILAIIIPKAKTTAEKLQMHGEAVNVDNISRKVSESFNDVKDDIKDFGKKNNINEQRFREAGRRTGDFLSSVGQLIRVILIILVKVIGVCLIIASIGGIVFSLAVLFGWENFLIFANHGFIDGTNVNVLVESLFATSTDKNLFTASFLITMITPAILIFLLGIRLLFDYRRIPAWIIIVLVVIWFGGLTLLASTGTGIYKQFQVETSFTENVPLELPDSDVLYLDIIKPEGTTYNFSTNIGGDEYFDHNNVTFPGINSTDIIYIGETEFTVENNYTDSLYHLRIRRESNGSTQQEAIANARSIVTSEKVIGDSLLINPYFAIRKEGKIRGQEVKYILSIPVGKSIHFNEESRKIIYDVPNITDTYDGKMINHTWKMTRDGLMNPHFSRKQKYKKEDDDD